MYTPASSRSRGRCCFATDQFRVQLAEGPVNDLGMGYRDLTDFVTSHRSDTYDLLHSPLPYAKKSLYATKKPSLIDGDLTDLSSREHVARYLSRERYVVLSDVQRVPELYPYTSHRWYINNVLLIDLAVGLRAHFMTVMTQPPIPVPFPASQTPSVHVCRGRECYSDVLGVHPCAWWWRLAHAAGSSPCGRQACKTCGAPAPRVLRVGSYPRDSNGCCALDQEKAMQKSAAVCLAGYLAALVVLPGVGESAAPLSQEHATAEQITSNPGGEFEPQWSPDGMMLSYGSGEMGDQNVAIVDVKTRTETLLTTGLGFVHATTWSPDGQHIAYATGSETENGFVSHIYIVEIKSRKVRQLTHVEGIDGSPTWSPDGTAIAFPSDRSGDFNIWIQPVDGSEAVMVTHDPELDHAPEWSPDGKAIAFHSMRGGNASIWILRLEDGTLTRLTDDKGNDQYPDWSPDGRYITFDSDRSGNQDIWVQPVAGGEAIRVTSDPAMDMRPSWSPDGRKIAFSSDRVGSVDVWVVAAPVGAGSSVK
jgi:Tol biopolymer transport system component